MADICNEEVKVSFLVPVYNVGEFIEPCMRSLLEQTLQEIEIVIVDDGSTDDTIEKVEHLLEEYPSRRDQVRIIRHEQNKGIAVGRKDLLDAAKGEYVYYIDGDDYVELRMAELMYGKAKEQNADIVFCNYFYHTKDGYVVSNLAPNGEGEHGENLREDTLNRRITHYLTSRLMSRALFVENEIAWPVESIAEDLVIVTQATFFAHILAIVNEPQYHYRFNQNSYSRAAGEEKCVVRFYGNLANYEVLNGFMKRNNLTERYERGVFVSKASIRNCLLPLLGKRKYRRLFLNTFPEVNRAFLFGIKNHKPSWKERMWIICIWLGLYPKYKTFIFKHFLPGEGWYGKSI